MKKRGKQPKENFPPFNELAHFLINFLTPGGSYIFLRQFKRFYAYLGLLLMMALALPEQNFYFMAVFTLNIITGADASMIFKKLKNKQMACPKYNRKATFIATAIFVFLLLSKIFIS